jgi:cell wall-associated NlpC family hydrolase
LPLRLLTILCVLLLAACATAPRGGDRAPVVRGPAPGASLAQGAVDLIGTPYRWGGTTTQGLDCSGLVLLTHRAAGLAVPRTAAEQNRAATPVRRKDLLPGDLVFFRVKSRAVDHVGVYAGGGRFVHAPGSGRAVSLASLDDPWFAQRFAGAGRLWTPARSPGSQRGRP